LTASENVFLESSTVASDNVSGVDNFVGDQDNSHEESNGDTVEIDNRSNACLEEEGPTEAPVDDIEQRAEEGIKEAPLIQSGMVPQELKVAQTLPHSATATAVIEEELALRSKRRKLLCFGSIVVCAIVLVAVVIVIFSAGGSNESSKSASVVSMPTLNPTKISVQSVSNSSTIKPEQTELNPADQLSNATDVSSSYPQADDAVDGTDTDILHSPHNITTEPANTTSDVTAAAPATLSLELLTPFLPMVSPTVSPSATPPPPSSRPTRIPLAAQTLPPTSRPTPGPSPRPVKLTTESPTNLPTSVLTLRPTGSPTPLPTPQPTLLPTLQPTPSPTPIPTLPPTLLPTLQPTPSPTPLPTLQPTVQPTHSPTSAPTLQPTSQPTLSPTQLPTLQPTTQPTPLPTPLPSPRPTSLPTLPPTPLPTLMPITARPTPSPTSGCSLCDGGSLVGAPSKLYVALDGTERTCTSLQQMFQNANDAECLGGFRRDVKEFFQIFCECPGVFPNCSLCSSGTVVGNPDREYVFDNGGVATCRRLEHDWLKLSVEDCNEFAAVGLTAELQGFCGC